MKHLSLLATLLLTSSMVYADWITKGTDYKGDCLEMMCDCVEDDEGKGYCCPNGTSFTNTGNSHPTYTPCKCPINQLWDNTSSKCVQCLTDTDCPSNQYCNKNTKTCQPILTCATCQKFDMNKGQCVADTSKNNQAVGTCGKCNNGSVVVDTTKETVCKTCNTSNWTLTNKANGTQVQDVCHMCKDGNVVLKDPAKQVISNNTCVECLTDANCPSGYTCDTNKKECQKACVKNVDWGNSCTDSCQCKNGTGKHSGWSGVCQEGVCCFRECTVCSSEAYCPQKGCSSKSDCPSGHYCSDGDCLACPQRVTIPTYQGCKSTSDNRLCVIGTRIGSTSYKKNTQWVNPYQCTYNVYFSGTLDTKAKSKAHNKVYINGGHALGYDSRKYTYSDSYIGQLAPGGGVEVEIYNNSGRPCSSLSAWMELAE